jgi:hypothetical protein
MNPPQFVPAGAFEQPPLRKVTVNVLTDLGWMHGIFNLPPHQSLVDFLAPGVQVIKCTRVRLSQKPEVLPFLAPPAGEPDRDAAVHLRSLWRTG